MIQFCESLEHREGEYSFDEAPHRPEAADSLGGEDSVRHRVWIELAKSRTVRFIVDVLDAVRRVQQMCIFLVIEFH